MRKIKFIVVVLVGMLAATITTHAQSVFVLQNRSRTIFTTTISAAQTKMQNGDTLYLPPKPIDGNFSFSKRVAIIGAGYHPDTAAVTGITKITGWLEFAKGSKGSSMTGVRTEGNIYVRDSLINIIRCNMATLEVQHSIPISQVYIGDCVIRNDVVGGNDNVTNFLVERCVIHGNIGGGNKTNNMMIKNCAILYNSNYFCSGIANLILQNNIILCNGGYQFFGYGSTSFTIKNNLFVNTEFAPASFVMSGNVFGIPEADIFVNKANGDYHIKPTLTQAFTLATDGKQVGVFGTDYPFLVPTYAPRFVSINNAENVVNGKLSVKMKVEARDR